MERGITGAVCSERHWRTICSGVQAQSSDGDDDVELVSVRELPVPSAAQVLKMLDSIQQFVGSQSESMELNASIEELIHSVEKLKLKNQKQGDIRSYIK